MTTARPIHILFLCTGNSCRSQMAEGFARARGGERVVARSAGIVAHGKNPRAIAAMADIGIDISDQASTQLTDAMLHEADLVVTVCGHADEQCPVLPPGVRREHWPLPDPARAVGSEADIVACFHAVRDDVEQRVEALLASLAEGADTP